MDLKSIIKPRANEEPASADVAVPLGGTRAQAIQRLQVGFFGLGAILLLIGVANVFLSRAELAEEAAVPEAAPTVAAEDEAPQQSDPLADAGVVPELPAEPEEEAGKDGATVGNANPATGNTTPDSENDGGAAQP